LVKAWGAREKIWPDVQELAAGLDAHRANRTDLSHTLKTLIVNHAKSLKEEPLRVELLADEFMTPTPISDALGEVRRQLANEHRAIFEQIPELEDDDAHALFIVLMAAASFLAMRAAISQGFMGEDIATKANWSNLMDKFERIIDLAVLGDNIEHPVNGDGTPEAAK